MSAAEPGYATLAEHGLGTRIVDGAAWPVVNRLQVFRPDRGRPTWIVEIALCQGTAAETRAFRVKRDAVAYFEAHQVLPGYVRDRFGTVYVQKPDVNQWGYSLFRQDQVWPGGFGVDTWEIVDPAEVSDDDKALLGPLLEEKPRRPSRRTRRSRQPG